MAGGRFLILFNSKGYILTLDNYERLLYTLNERSGHMEMASWSDQEFVIDTVEQGGPFTITHLPERQCNNFRFATGEFFPFIHIHPDSHIA